MTREEALKVLNEYKVYGCGVCLEGVLVDYNEATDRWRELDAEEALKIAISALNFEADCRSCMWREKYEELTEQTEPSDLISHEEAWDMIGSDLISRAKALMELNGACSNWQDDATVAEIIQALPSVSAERVIRCKDCIHNTICSKSVQTTEHDKFTTTIGYKKIDFCSWAKMKGGTE